MLCSVALLSPLSYQILSPEEAGSHACSGGIVWLLCLHRWTNKQAVGSGHTGQPPSPALHASGWLGGQFVTSFLALVSGVKDGGEA